MYVLNSGWAAILLYHAGIFAAAWITKTSLKRIGGGFKLLPAVGLWLAGLSAAPAVVILLPILLGLSAQEVSQHLNQGLISTGLTGASFLVFVVYLCVPHPGIEELGWREMLFVDSKKPHLRDFEFASYHLLVMNYFFPKQWPFFLGTLISLATMGWIWRLLKMRFNGLAVPVWFHAGGDLGVVLGVWWLLRQYSGF